MLRIEGVAEELKISKRTVEKLIADGIFPAFKLRGLVFLDFDEVIEAIRFHGRKDNQSTDSAER